MDNRIVLIGGGGHCKVIIDAIHKAGLYEIYGIIDRDISKEEVLGVPVIGDDSCLFQVREAGINNAFITVGSVGDCGLRIKLYEKAKRLGFILPVIIHPDSIIGEDVLIEEGTFVAARAVINSGTRVGKNVIVNTSSSVDP